MLLAGLLALVSSQVFSATEKAGAKKAAQAKPAATRPAGTQGYRDEIYHTKVEPYQGPPRSGREVYAYRCAACHARTTQGAPMPGDDLEWKERAGKGMKVLMKHVREGFKEGLMPAKGGCLNCSEAELEAAVRYMLSESGIKPDELPR